MKWFRRRANAYARGLADLSEQLILPSSVRRVFQRWMNDAHRTVRVPHGGFGKHEAVLFTDASLQGWGAILVFAGGEIHVAGGKWAHAYDSGDINMLEAKAATAALTAFDDVLRDGVADGVVDTLRVVVDNTSVQSSAKRGAARSELLNLAMVPLLRGVRGLQIAVSFEYIATKMNPSDDVSRGRPWQPELLAQAMGLMKTSDGAGRAGYSRVTPFVNNAA